MNSVRRHLYIPWSVASMRERCIEPCTEQHRDQSHDHADQLTRWRLLMTCGCVCFSRGTLVVP